MAVLADRSVADWPLCAGVRRVVVPEGARVGALLIPGPHNQVNAAAAIEAVLALAIDGIDRARAAAAARTFAGLPHRLRLVATRDVGPGAPVRCYDDSKSTTPEATARAVGGMKSG